MATYRYDTPRLSRTSTIEEISVRMLQQIGDKGIFENFNEVYFIAHSMGGLVVKRVLVELNRPAQVDKLRKVKAALFIAAPTQGSNSAELASFLSANPQIANMKRADLNVFLQGLENQWQNLMRDRQASLFPRSFCAYETKPTYGTVVVSRVYAASHCDQTPFPVDENHIDIVKPAGRDGAIYDWARARILETSILTQPTVIGAQTKFQSGDHVSDIETLLGEVPDPEYRKLVAAVIHAFEPKSELAVGALVNTTDGTRKVDVILRSSDRSRVTAIDIVYTPMERKAGVEVVDAAESKKRDIKADVMLLCSNTGFDEMAIKKAKRARIGIMSVLHRGDQRVKAVIEEIMYLRKWDLNPFTFVYHGEAGLPKNVKLHDIKFNGESVDAWLIWRAMMIAVHNPTIVIGRDLTASFNLKKTTEFEIGEKRIKLDGFSVRFHPHVKWFSQTVQLDASTGIYDYARGKVRLAGGKNSYIIQGIDFYEGIPLPFPPEIEDLEGGLIPGEIDVSLHTFGIPHEIGDYNPMLEAIVRPEDLTTRIDNTP